MNDKDDLAIPDHVRRDILDALLSKPAPVEGRAGLIPFLRRAWNLREMPSRDHRFDDAERDIWQHMVNNIDWTLEELYIDRLGILDAPDPQFAKFLEAVAHPLVRSSEEEQQEYVEVINNILKAHHWVLAPSPIDAHRYVFQPERSELERISGSRVPEEENNRNNPDKFEVVLSFAGEDREFVDRVAEGLKQHGVSLFYDRYHKATLWGKDLYEHLAKVYGGDARYCVMFISRHYADKVWTTHERRSAYAAAIERRVEYILPARFDDTVIDGLRSTIGYVDLRNETSESLVKLILEKLGRK
jgi:hypothetical protein